MAGIRGGLSALLVLILLAACGQQTQAPAPNQARTRITFVTDWRAQAEHGGFYQALAKGLYASRGLDVVIRAGGPAVNVPQLLAGGAADFAIGRKVERFKPLGMTSIG